MRVLLDSCVWGGTVPALREAGHDVQWAGDWSEDPGDEEILAYAYQENRVLITLDKDFGELAVLHGQSHCGIVRLVDFSARQQARACLEILLRHPDELASGALITVESSRIRIRVP